MTGGGSGIEEPLVACCGGKGLYGVAKGAGCGYGYYKACENPDKYGSWDALDPTEAVYMAIAMSLIQSSYAHPSFATLALEMKAKMIITG